MADSQVKGLRTSAALLAYAKAKYLPLLRRNWAFWLPVQCAFFLFLPQEDLVTYTCFAGVVWNRIVSALTHRRAASGGAASEEDVGFGTRPSAATQAQRNVHVHLQGPPSPPARVPARHAQVVYMDAETAAVPASKPTAANTAPLLSEMERTSATAVDATDALHSFSCDQRFSE